MEQIVQKPPFPIKTKIAAWWMIIIGSISLIGLFGSLFFLGVLFSPPVDGEFAWGFVIMYFLPLLLGVIGIFLITIIPFLLPGVYLLRKRKWAWKFAIIAQILAMTVLIILIFSLCNIEVIITTKKGVGYPEEVTKKHLYPNCFSKSLIFSSPVFIILLIPLILLLLDRKNFWKIAS
jgi:hypothetical protein